MHPESLYFSTSEDWLLHRFDCIQRPTSATASRTKLEVLSLSLFLRGGPRPPRTRRGKTFSPSPSSSLFLCGFGTAASTSGTPRVEWLALGLCLRSHTNVKLTTGDSQILYTEGTVPQFNRSTNCAWPGPAPGTARGASAGLHP